MLDWNIYILHNPGVGLDDLYQLRGESGRVEIKESKPEITFYGKDVLQEEIQRRFTVYICSISSNILSNEVYFIDTFVKSSVNLFYNIINRKAPQRPSNSAGQDSHIPQPLPSEVFLEVY